MNKKLVCILLAIILAVPMLFTGCSGSKDDEDTTTDTGSKRAMTLTLYGITGESTTEEAISEVQERFNDYTEGKFNTHVILRLYTEDEYYGILDEKIAEIEKRIAEEEAEAKRKKAEKKASKDKKPADETTAAETEAETKIDEKGKAVTVYPEEKGTQVDIFMVRGRTKLQEYFEKDQLTALNSSLNDSSGKILSKYINSSMFTSVTLEGSIYGIPNNSVCGEYTYLLLNKELVDKYYYSESDLSTYAKLGQYLDDVAKNDPDYIPLYNEAPASIEWLTDEFSYIGGVINASSYEFSSLRVQSMLKVNGYLTYLQNSYDYRAAGYIVDGDYSSLPENEKIAAAFIKGDYTVRDKYSEDYYVVVYQKPTARASDRPGTVFCVSAYTADAARCMEIITALNTSPTLRNLFQYGIEGKNYEIMDDTGYVNMLNDDYSMNMYDTGNMFILTPNTSMSESMLTLAANEWYYAKLQNRDVVMTPYCLFTLKYITADNYMTESEVIAAKLKEMKDNGEETEGVVLDYDYYYTKDILDHMVTLSAEIKEKIDSFVEYTDEEGNTVTLTDYCKELRDEMVEDPYYEALIDAENLDSPLSQYNAWCEKYLPAPAGI